MLNVCIDNTYIIKADTNEQISSKDEVEQFIINDMVLAGIISDKDVESGFVADSNGNTNGSWSNTITRINRSSVITKTSYSSTSASNGRLFFMRDSSDPLSGLIA